MENCYFCTENKQDMRRKNTIIVLLLSLFLVLTSCASNKSRAMRNAERQLEKQEKESKKQYDKAKSAHYKHQAKKTKKMMKQDKRHAEKMRRKQRSNPFFS